MSQQKTGLEDVMDLLKQAYALASLTHGDCFETFSNRSDEIQNNTLWLLGYLIGAAHDVLEANMSAARKAMT